MTARAAPLVKCPRCQAPVAATEALFEHCDVSWPNQRWLGFECPTCHEDSKIEVANDAFDIGDIDGAPGPCFMPDEHVELHGLRYRASSRGVTVALGRKRKLIPAR